MKFTKMEGIGNDYVYVNCLTQTVADPPALAREISDRHFGVGADGLILIKPGDQADFEMDMYNADGSRGKMCGNGIRCVGKYVYDHGLTHQTRLRIQTLSGIRELELYTEDGKVQAVRVDMGIPMLDPASIPLAGVKDPLVDAPVEIGGARHRVTCVSMGNPHCVLRVEDLTRLDLPAMGPVFAQHSLFPEGVNTEFVQVQDAHTLGMRVWERGSGETLACGTGACAVAVAGILNGWILGEEVSVQLLGGSLKLWWDRAGSGHVFMTGPARTVFEGEYHPKG